MELHQLRAFLEVARSENMTHSADTLNITQPALSKTIARLEEELGIKLFDRKGRGIQLNEFGKVALRYTERILNTMGDMQVELEAMKEGAVGSVCIGSSFPAAEPNWILTQLRTLSLSYPDISIQLRQYPQDLLPQALLDRELDLAISTSPILAAGVHWCQLFTEPIGVILSKSHPLAAKETLSLADLRLERFYCNNSNSDLQSLTIQLCRQAGFEPNIHFQCEFPSFIGEAVSLCLGVSLISRRGQELNKIRQNRQSWEDDIVYRPLREEWCCRVCGIAYLEDRFLSPACKKVLQCLLEVKDSTEFQELVGAISDDF